jgi:hypothetical protein
MTVFEQIIVNVPMDTLLDNNQMLAKEYISRPILELLERVQNAEFYLLFPFEKLAYKGVVSVVIEASKFSIGCFTNYIVNRLLQHHTNIISPFNIAEEWFMGTVNVSLKLNRLFKWKNIQIVKKTENDNVIQTEESI